MSRYQSNNVNSFNVSNSFHFGGAEEDSKVLAWLSPLERQIRHQDIRTQRVEGVGSWLLQTKQFRSWCNGTEEAESDHAALFCYGHPGVGKSFIASLVIDSLCDQARGQNMTVLCFYFDFASRKEQTPVNMLGSLLQQLVSGLGAIPEEVVKEYREQKKVIGGRGAEVSGIVRMFQAVSYIQPTFICIDALDECLPEHRVDILNSLNQILQRSPNTRLFMTGRPHISGEVERQLGGRATSLSITPTENDIILYAKEKLEKDTTPEVMTSKLKEDIMRSIPERIPETFLIISLNIESILRETTISRRKRRLEAMMDSAGLGLEHVYGATLERIRAQTGAKSELAMATLMWVCHSDRPLKVDELCHALAVDIGSRNFDKDNVPLMATLLSCCQGLITVDKEGSTVRLIHHTLQEYLSSHLDLFPRAHSIIAETCLTYLNSQQVKSLSPYPLPNLEDVPFLKYASLHWGIHAKKGLPDHLKLFALGVLNQYENQVSATLLWQEVQSSELGDNINNYSQFTGLHCASYFGIVDLVKSLMEINGLDTNKQDSTGSTPLSCAAMMGHDVVVELLLERQDVNPDLPDNEGGTPLLWAANNGHDVVVKLLLERQDVSPDLPDNEGSTPLSCAAAGGHDVVVKLLLERQEVNPDLPDNEGRTPLSCAAANGHDVVVTLLSARGSFSPDRPATECQGALRQAAPNQPPEVVKPRQVLVDVTRNRPKSADQKPRPSAIRRGYNRAVGLLRPRKRSSRLLP